MQLFYIPGIRPPGGVLSPEESAHALRALRLRVGEALLVTDGAGALYTAVVVKADPRACEVEITDSLPGGGKRDYVLEMAVAPTKNSERLEWFLEKATEVGCDRFIPLLTAHAERRSIKHDRSEKVITSAMKQSLQAWHPTLEAMTTLREVVSRPFGGVKLIAHCRPCVGRRPLRELVAKGDDVLILIGPEGDFSEDEVALALANGFAEVSLGDNRLRTETAALAAVVGVALINQ